MQRERGLQICHHAAGGCSSKIRDMWCYVSVPDLPIKRSRFLVGSGRHLEFVGGWFLAPLFQASLLEFVGRSIFSQPRNFNTRCQQLSTCSQLRVLCRRNILMPGT